MGQDGRGPAGRALVPSGGVQNFGLMLEICFSTHGTSAPSINMRNGQTYPSGAGPRFFERKKDREYHRPIPAVPGAQNPVTPCETNGRAEWRTLVSCDTGFP